MRTSHRWLLFILASAFACLTLSTTAQAQVVTATVVLQEGDVPPTGDGTAVTLLDNPFTNGLGQVGFVGELVSGDHYIWVNNAIVWLGANAVGVILDTPFTTNRRHMGFSDAGSWIYQPEVGGVNDALWTNGGLFLSEKDPAPGYVGALINFLYNPIMLPSGAFYWVASIDTDANGSSDARAFYMNPDGVLGNTTIVLKSFDLVSGIGLDVFGLDFDYDVSDDGAHYAIVADLATGDVITDAGVVVDGVLATQEGVTPAAGTDLMDQFDRVAINNLGNYLISGDSDGATTADEYIIYNGAVAVSEGDTLGNITLTTPASVQAISLNNLNHAVHQWTFSGGEALFYSGDAGALGASAPILRSGDQVDVTGDGVADATITDLNATATNGSGLNLSDDGLVYVNVDLDYDGDGIGETLAILQITPAYCGDGMIQPGEICDDGGESATCNSNCMPAACGDGVVNMTALEECDTSGVETVDCDIDCTLAVCGDATQNVTAGEECDAGGEALNCDIDCTLVECGDYTINVSAGEDCDEGGADTATCDGDCTDVICGDGTHNLFAGELCDDGGPSATCDDDCTPAYCGDGNSNAAAGEDCDDAGESAACNLDCSAAACGDGMLNMSAGEECDAAGASVGCDADCSFAVCGDSDVNTAAGEDCDDGGESASCNDDCTAAVCGDGVLNVSAGEDCEDGNSVSGDGCSAACAFEDSSDGCGCKVGARDDRDVLGGLIPLFLMILALGVIRRRRQQRGAVMAG